MFRYRFGGKSQSNFIFINVVILFFQSLANPLLRALSTNVTPGLSMWTEWISALFYAWLIASKIDV